MLYKDSHLSDPELLSAADGELPARRQREVRAHLEACWACRTRRAELEHTVASFTAGYRSILDRSLPPDDRAAARLKTLLKTRLVQHLPPASTYPWRWAAVLAPILILLLAVTIAEIKLPSHSGTGQMVSALETEIVPNPQLTPGEATPASKTQVCQGNMQAGQSIPESLRRAVLAEYGVKNAPQRAYEVDFLITPELGGSASIRNLWPEPYFSRTWNARVKDALEERLHKLVCRGDLDLSTAQREIATNWVSAYKKYVRTDDPM